MIKITVELEVADLSEVPDLAQKLGIPASAPITAETTTSTAAPDSTVDAVTESEAQEAETPPAKTAKKKSAKKKTRKTTRPETQDDAPAADAPTKENVRDKLAAVGDKIDFGAVREIVQRFGANGLKELDESQYADVIEACEAKLAE